MKEKNILKKLCPDILNRKQAKTVEQISVIGHSSDAVGWRPVPYRIPERFEAFMENLDQDIEDILNHANPDMYNAHFYDEVVMREVEIALRELYLQRSDHERTEHNIRLYQTASRLDIENHMKQMIEAQKKIEEELKYE